MNLIFSADDKWGIGKDNKLIFHAKEDMKRFRELTTGNVVIMGRKTLESLPASQPLKNRVNVVLTTDRDFTLPGAVICHCVDELLEYVKDYNSEDLFVIGGESVYKELLSHCGTAYVTRFYAEAEADRFMPDFDSLDGWKIAEKSAELEENGLKFQFIMYKRTIEDII